MGQEGAGGQEVLQARARIVVAEESSIESFDRG
jgi:hypothetical protein